MTPVEYFATLHFPLYVLHTDEVVESDGILWIEDQVLDDKNMKGDTLGKRRLQTPMKSIYPLKVMIKDIIGLIKHEGQFYIDSSGEFIRYNKTLTTELKYHKIKRVVKKRFGQVVLWVKDCPFPFDIESPPAEGLSWAGLLYYQGLPWLPYEFCENKKKDTWRKI